MTQNIQWQNALVIGASGGIGAALVAELRARGVATTGLSRRDDGLDLTDAQSVEQVLGAVQDRFDLMLVATGALEINGAVPEKALGQIEAQAMLDQFALNAVGPALVLRHAARLIAKDRPAHLGLLSARVGSIGDNRLGGWYSYRASKAALNQIVRTASIELARSHRQLSCAALHPGTVATSFTRKYAGHHKTETPEVSARHSLDVLGALTPQDTGAFRDWAGKTVPW